MTARWPFVGRSEELELIGEAMTDTRVPGIVLAGSAGVGKTRLLREAVRIADDVRYFARTVVATPATAGIPFGALAPLLPLEMPGVASQGNLLRFAADALAGPAGKRRLVLGVDDAHVLDETSAGLLHQLAQSGRAFVLASVRSGEPAPDPITALWKDELVDRVDVQALSRNEMESVLRDVLGAHVEAATIDRLWLTTGGNMLFLREVVNAGLDSGAFAEVEGVWRWVGAWVMAPRLAELLTHRIGRLEPEELHTLELIALGAPIDTGSLRRLVTPEVLQSVEEKDLLWLRNAGDHEEVHLAHPLYGEVLRAGCPPLRTRRWKSRLADAVEANGAHRTDDWLRIATWRLDAGEKVRPDVLMSGVRQAWARFDLALTERLAREAIAAGVGLEAVRVLWRVLFLGQHNHEVEQVLAQWMLAPMSAEDRSDLVFGRALNLVWGLDDLAQGLAVLRAAEATAPTAQLREEYVAFEALIHQHAAETETCLEIVGGLLENGMTNRHAEAVARTAQVLGLSYFSRLDSAQSLMETREFVRPWDDELPFLGVMLDLIAVQALAFGGRLEWAEALATSAFDTAEDSGSDFAVYIHRVGKAQVARLQGRLETARLILREGLSRYRDRGVGYFHVPAFLLGELAHTEALLGNGEAAQAAMQELDDVSRSSMQAFDLWSDLAQPWVAVAAGDRKRGIELAAQIAERHRSSGARGIEVAALHDLVRLNQPAKALARLVELSAELRGPYVKICAKHAKALTDKDGSALDQVAADFEKIGATLLAAEAAAQASGVHQEVGLQSSARAAQTKAAILLERCEGPKTPALEAIRAPKLTARELDIARLAAGGLSNREIAERLVVSKRTVDNHLHQAYLKLGISGRDALLELFGAGDPDSSRSNGSG